MRGGDSGAGCGLGACGRGLSFGFGADEGDPDEAPYLGTAGFLRLEGGGVSGKADRSRGVPFIA